MQAVYDLYIIINVYNRVNISSNAKEVIFLKLRKCCIGHIHRYFPCADHRVSLILTPKLPNLIYVHEVWNV